MEEVKDSSPEKRVVGSQPFSDSASSQNVELPCAQSLTSTCSSNRNSNSSSSFKSESDRSLLPESREERHINFDEKFRKYYVEPCKNFSANFDNYLSKALTLVNYFPDKNDEVFLKQIGKKLVFSKHLDESVKFDGNKKTLILDMDETLLHTDVDCQFQYHDELLSVDIGAEKNVLLPLIKRPFLDNFLSFAKENFNLILFTASQKEYAEPILNYIERKEKYFCLKLYRSSCIFLEPGITIKDLRIFRDIPIEDILIIENNLFAFANQLSNGILLSSFFHDLNDQMLLNLMCYLTKLMNSDDILEANEKTFKFSEYLVQIRNDLKDLH